MDGVSTLATTLDADWLGACRRATECLRGVLEAKPTSLERMIETGALGQGGDRTLVIDAEAEACVFAELDRLHAEGARFTALSEERGEADYGDRNVLVVIDPIDGSVNAKRGLPHHALSIAVADGPTMADVVFAYVYDLGPEEEWWARRGEGAWLDGRRLDGALPERRDADGRLEIVAVESTDPRWLLPGIEALATRAHRLRAIGAMALSLCQVSAVRVDGMLSLLRCRPVDVAAAQLIVRESGGHVAFVTARDGPLSAPLGLEPFSPIVAARTPEALRELGEVLR
jgi:myo-inositol-1(or 4)-monophosphatase